VVAVSADTEQTTLGGGRDDPGDLQGLGLFLYRQPTPADREELIELAREAHRRGLVGGDGE
jgi:hypothetical protein